MLPAGQLSQAKVVPPSSCEANSPSPHELSTTHKLAVRVQVSYSPSPHSRVQSRQAVAPASGWWVPGRHGAQTSLSQNCPAGHGHSEPPTGCERSARVRRARRRAAIFEGRARRMVENCLNKGGQSRWARRVRSGVTFI